MWNDNGPHFVFIIEQALGMCRRLDPPRACGSTENSRTKLHATKTRTETHTRRDYRNKYLFIFPVYVYLW